jgi:hypothetical protein
MRKNQELKEELKKAIAKGVLESAPMDEEQREKLYKNLGLVVEKKNPENFGVKWGWQEPTDVADKFKIGFNEPDIEGLKALNPGIQGQKLLERIATQRDKERATAAGEELDNRALERMAEEEKAASAKKWEESKQSLAEGFLDLLTAGAYTNNKNARESMPRANPRAFEQTIANAQTASQNSINNAADNASYPGPPPQGGQTGAPAQAAQGNAPGMPPAVNPSMPQGRQPQAVQGMPQITGEPQTTQGMPPPRNPEMTDEEAIKTATIMQAGGKDPSTARHSGVFSAGMYEGLDEYAIRKMQDPNISREERGKILTAALGKTKFSLKNMHEVPGNNINALWRKVLADEGYKEIEAETMIEANNVKNQLQYLQDKKKEIKAPFDKIKGSDKQQLKTIIDMLKDPKQRDALLNMTKAAHEEAGDEAYAFRSIVDYIPEDATDAPDPSEAPEPEMDALPEPTLPEPALPESQQRTPYVTRLGGEASLNARYSNSFHAAGAVARDMIAVTAQRQAAMGAIADKIDNMKFELQTQAFQLAKVNANASPQQYKTAVLAFQNKINTNPAYSPNAPGLTQMEREARRQIIRQTTQGVIGEMQKSAMETQRKQNIVNAQNRVTTIAQGMAAGDIKIQNGVEQTAAALNSARPFLTPAQFQEFSNNAYLKGIESAGQWAMNEAAKNSAHGEIADVAGILEKAVEAMGAAQVWIRNDRGEDAAAVFKGESAIQLQKTAEAASDHNFKILDAAQNQYTAALDVGKAGWPDANAIAYKYAPLRNRLMQSGALTDDDARRAAPYFKFKTDEGSGGSGGSGGNGRTIYSALDGLAKDYAKEVENDLHGRGGLSFLEAQEMIMKDAGAEKTDDGAREYAAKALASELLKSTNIKEQDFDPIWTRFFGSPMSAAEIKDAYEGMTTSEAQQFSNELYASRIQDAIQTLRNKPENEPTDKYMEAHQPELAARFTVAQFGLINDALTADLRTKAQEIGLTNAELSPIFDSFQTPLPINSARSARTNLATNETYAAMEETLIDRYARIRSATDAGFGEKDEHKMQLESSGGRAILTDTNKRGKTEYFEIVKEGDKYYLNTFKEALYPEDDQSKKLNASGEMLPHQYAREPDRRLNLSYNVNVEAAPNGYTIPIEKRRRLELEGKIDEYKDWKWPKQK